MSTNSKIDNTGHLRNNCAGNGACLIMFVLQSQVVYKVFYQQSFCELNRIAHRELRNEIGPSI